MSRNLMTLKRLVVILFFLIGGIILLFLGVWFLTDPVSIAVPIVLFLYFIYNIPVDYVFVRNIIFIFGIVFVVFGVIFLVISTLFTIKAIQQREGHEERHDYMNLGWLREQHYELGRSLQDIATEQGVSIGTIKEWVNKLDVKPADLSEEE